jgi:hypothetical protein
MRKVLWILLALLCLTGTVSAQTSASYDLHWNVIGGGGGGGSSASYQLQGTVGQITGIATSSSYTLSAGYWQMVGPVCMRGDLNCDGTVDWGDVVMCAYMSWNLIPPDTAAADFNDSGAVDWGDVVQLAYYYWGLIPDL